MYQRRDFYRHSRYVHGWLSAFAFLTLLYFSVTGLLLNHPEWFEPAKTEQTTQLIGLRIVIKSCRLYCQALRNFRTDYFRLFSFRIRDNK